MTVTPAHWTLGAGGTVDLAAYLDPADDACEPIESLFAWQVTGLSDLLGSLNASTGADVQFQSFGYETGTAFVEATVSGYQLCNSFVFPYSADSTVSITSVAPLYASSLEPAATAILPGASDPLSLSFSGGLGPYNVTVDFGDGSTYVEQAPSPGTIVADHSYSVGRYLPTAEVEDGLGEASRVVTGSPIVVSPALTIVPSAGDSCLEVDRPALLTANISGGLPPYTVVWTDATGASHLGLDWWVDPASAGTESVTVRVTDAQGDSSSSTLVLPVDPPLDLSIRSMQSVVDVGEPLRLELNLTGGAPPYQLNGSAAPAGSQFDLKGVLEGPLIEVLVPAEVGTLWADLSLSDSLGGSYVGAVPLAEVSAAPTLAVNGSAAEAEVGDPFGVVALATGSGPFNWSWTTSSPFANASPLTSGRYAAGLFAWSGVPTSSGPCAIQITVTDAAGISTSDDLTLHVAPALAASLRIDPTNDSGNGSLSIALQIAGGAPPYAAQIEISDGEAASANRSLAGTWIWVTHPNGSGEITVSASVEDAAGATRSELATFAIGGGPGASAPGAPPDSPGPNSSRASIPAPGPGAPSGPISFDADDFASGLGAGLFVAAIGAILYGRLRRQQPARAPPPLRPTESTLAVVQRILEESGGIDRESLFLLCEEDGIDRAQAAAALDLWATRGRAEPSADGTEPPLWSWRERSEPGAGSSTDSRTTMEDDVPHL